MPLSADEIKRLKALGQDQLMIILAAAMDTWEIIPDSNWKKLFGQTFENKRVSTLIT